MRPILLLLSLCLIQLCFGQNLPTLTTEQLKEDTEIFENYLRQVHPGLYWYNDSSEVNEMFAQLRNSINQPMTATEFYRQLAPVIANVKCGHTWLNMPRPWWTKLDNGNYRLPFNVFLEDEKTIISHDFTADSVLTLGWELVSMNDVALSEIRKTLASKMPRDGYNETFTKYIISGNFWKYYQTFYPLSETVTIVVKNPETQEEQIFQLDCITSKEVGQLFTERYKTNKPRPPLAFYKKLEQPNTGYLYIRTFSSGWLKSEGIKYKKFLEESFITIQQEGIETLIIDLRYNGGGNDSYGSTLCQYLLNEPFDYFEKMELVTRKFPYKKYRDTRYLGLVAPFMFKKVDDSGKYYIKAHTPLKKQSPKKEVFTGKVIVLTNGSTFSTSADVCATLYNYKRATFVGEEVGGGYYGNNSAITTSLTLPNTNLTVRVPIVRYYNPVDKKEWYGRGVKPDFPVPVMYEDIRNKKDRVMEKALEIRE